MKVCFLKDEVKVTRKYQVTIPESVRAELGVKIGDKLLVKSENNRIIMEAPKRVSNPSDTLWCLFGKPLDVDAVKLVEESLEEAQPSLEARKTKRADEN
jgi:AbrB family looped-hinge helix DNA binding protein